MEDFSRRHFFGSLMGAGSLLSLSGLSRLNAEQTAPLSGLKGRLYLTLKYGMVAEGATVAEKFAIAKASGFEGIEMDAPGFDPAEVRRAVEETGLVFDGSVCAGHWNVRHSDPDESVRAEALKTLKGALRATSEAGGHTVLLVPGHGKDGTPEEVWNRSVENISKALPDAARLGVTIAIENVWNHFCYDHEGGADQTAERYVNYVDAFQSPFVGMQFDIGNHWKYGAMGDWIRDLGTRIVKLDIKGFSRAENKFTAIDAGDIDYPDVRKALEEIHFHGWCAAEVGGGDAAYLKSVAQAMNHAFALG